MTALLLGALLLTTQTPLHRLGPYLIVDDVRINGAGPFRFLVDTGAQSCLISNEVAAKAGITPTSRVELARSSGRIDLVPAASAHTLSIAGVEQHSVEVLFGAALDDVRALSGKIDGVIGQSYLRRLDSYLIENTRKLLILNPAPPKRGSTVPVDFESERPTVRLRGRQWVLDSGSPHTDQSRGLLATAAFDAVYVSNRDRIARLE